MKLQVVLKLFIICFSIFHASLIAGQNTNTSCDFKHLSQLIFKVKGLSTKADLDILFGCIGSLAEGNKDSVNKVMVFKYQFCDHQITHTFFVAFLKEKLIYIQKSFQKDDNCGSQEQFNKTLSNDYTYDDVKKKFGMEGDIKMITWDLLTSKQSQIEYIWRCCDKTTYYSVVFKEGKLITVNRFPKTIDYGRPFSDKKNKR